MSFELILYFLFFCFATIAQFSGKGWSRLVLVNIQRVDITVKLDYKTIYDLQLCNSWVIFDISVLFGCYLI